MLKRDNRLKRQKDFDYVYKKGRLTTGSLFNVKFAANNLPDTRLGFVVSKKSAKLATARNKVKRKLRAAAQECLPNIAQGYDLVISIKSAALNKEYEELKTELDKMFKKAKLLK